MKKEGGTIITTPPAVSVEEGDDRTYQLVLQKLRNYDLLHLGPHAPSLTSEESAATRRRLGWAGATLASGAKAMVIKNGRGNVDGPFVLAVMAADRKLDWKRMKKLLGPKSRSKSARMATVEEVWDVTGCVPGAVPPFGSVGTGGALRTFVDRSLQRQGDVINFNCGLRTRSVQMAVSDYLDAEEPELCDFIVEE